MEICKFKKLIYNKYNMKIFVGYTDQWGEDNLFGLFKTEKEIIDFAYEKFDNAEIVDSGTVDDSCSWSKFEYYNYKGEKVDSIVYIKEVDI